MHKTDTQVMTLHENNRDRLTQEALSDSDAGQMADHQSVLACADSLDSDQPLPVPADVTARDKQG